MRFVRRALTTLLLAGSLLGSWGCSRYWKHEVEPLSEDKASYGSIRLRYEYAKALRTLDLNTLAGFYHSLGSPEWKALAHAWKMPTAQVQNGIILYRDENREIPPNELPAFIAHFSDSYDQVTRAQIWFAEFRRVRRNELAIRVWVEINGQKALSLVNHRGSWLWKVTRANEKDPWRIAKQTLLDWDETRSEAPMFAETAAKKGIQFTQEVGEKVDLSIFIPEVHSGSGVAAADFDGDGKVDLYFGNGRGNHLYRNRGHGKFEDVTQKSGTGYVGITRGIVFADLTGDGRPDLYLCNADSPNVLYRNRGDGTFEDFTAQSGTGASVFSTSAAVADVDLDGDLDLFVAVYRLPNVFWPNLEGDDGAHNLLFINDGQGHFTEESEKRGLTDTRWSLATSFGDFDNDGDPDLFVANDFGIDNLYVNQGNGTFREESKKRGIRDRGFSMSASWGDFNNDGLLDLYVSKMTSGTSWMFPDPRFPMRGPQKLFRRIVQRELKKATAGNSLFLNQGDGTFKDVAVDQRVNVAHWAWGSGFVDFDNDGDLDLYCVNGFWSGKVKDDT